MEIRNLYPGSWGSNCYLLTANRRAAVVDPSADAHTILNAVKAEGATLDFILLTHGHFDHIVSVDRLRELTGAPLYIHKFDAEMLTDAQKNAFYTFFRLDRSYRPADRLLSDGDELTLGDEPIRVIHTPGHSQGSVCYLCNDELLLTGDTLFSDTYGRYDLWGGDGQTLLTSLSEMRNLPQSLPIYPGHGESVILKDALDRLQHLFD